MAQGLKSEHMEDGLKALAEQTAKAFDFHAETGELSPLDMAFVGDAVCSLIFRTLATSGGARPVEKMHKYTEHYVNAAAQSEMMRAIQPHLTQEESAVYRRGRNSKAVTHAKNQSVTDYRRATGYEALLGFLYLNHKWQRLIELVRIGYDEYERDKNEK